jgi:transcriptional regulator with XRE-family HTH domain
MPTKHRLTPALAARITTAQFRGEAKAAREAEQRGRQQRVNPVADTAPIEPADAFVMAKFIGNLRQQREQAGLSLSDVAKRSGIDRASVSRLENGWYSNPTVSTLARYARAIGRELTLGLRRKHETKPEKSGAPKRGKQRPPAVRPTKTAMTTGAPKTLVSDDATLDKLRKTRKLRRAN